MSTTIFANHTPNTHKVYYGLGENGKSGWYIMFLDSQGNSRNAKGGKIYTHRQNAHRDCEKLNHPVKHVLSKAHAIAAEAYWDEKTLTVTPSDEGYTLSIQVGQMPPYYSQDFKTIEEAEEEIRDRSHFPLYLNWEAVKED